MTVRDPITPIVKWAGGKRQLLDSILRLVPDDPGTMCEPFFGGGAVSLAARPGKLVMNDLNGDLVLTYRVVRDDVESLIGSLGKHENTAEYFYRIRDLDRDRVTYDGLSDVEKASRLLYLNKTCFNGLFRVNASGQFNVPFGRYGNPNIVNADGLRAVSRYLNEADVELCSEDFEPVLSRVPGGSFVYLDPPYDPVSETASFTGYSKSGFGRAEQERLKRCCDALTERGVRFLLSNSATGFIRDLYKDYTVEIVHAGRAVNSDARKRGPVEEVLVRNY